MRTNDELKTIYDRAYAGQKSYAGEAGSFFTFSTDDVTDYVIRNVDFAGMRVLEVGCGTGETAAAMARAGAASVYAIDYSHEAVATSRARHSAENLTFEVKPYSEVSGRFDIVLLQEVIEHLDDPEAAIVALMERVEPVHGKLVLTCPNFSNVRGHVWMTLLMLLEVPMSLTDLHYFCPFDFEEIAERNGLSLRWTTFAHHRVTGERLIQDLDKRLTNALRDANLDNSRVPAFLEWLAKVVAIESEPTPYNGGKGFYVFTKR